MLIQDHQDYLRNSPDISNAEDVNRGLKKPFKTTLEAAHPYLPVSFPLRKALNKKDRNP